MTAVRLISKVTMLLALVTVVTPWGTAAQITPEIIDAAKKEGEVVLYGAITVNASKPIGDLFEKKYGIKMKTLAW